ncbi:MAG: O-antigen ligase family protein [Myxococcota bacterium]|nr:O-antigen ligase family protein [Myxococcota bacterium]
MQAKHLIFLLAFATLVPAGTLVASWSQRARDVVFVLMVFGTAFVKSADSNFLSREWYRGSTVGIEISALDFLSLVLIASTALAGKQRPRVFWTPSLGVMLLYFVWCVISVAMAEPKLFGVFELSKLLRGMVLFVAVASFVRGRRELLLLLGALTAVALTEGLIALRDRYLFGFYRIGASLGHPNSLSLYCCMLTPVLLSGVMAKVSTWLRAAAGAGMMAALVCVLLTVSRTGVVTILLVTMGTLLFTMDWRFSVKKLVIGTVSLIAASAMFYKASDSIAGRFEDRSLEMEYSGEGTEGRGVYFRLASAIYRDKPLGVGLNNWSYAVSATYGPPEGFAYTPYVGTDTAPDQEVPYGSKLDAAQAAPAHNLLALTLGELGAPGVALFVLLWLRWFSLGIVFVRKRSAELSSRMAIGLAFGVSAAFLQSFTEWIFRQTNIFFLFHVLVGALASLYWHRRQEKRQRRWNSSKPGGTASLRTQPEAALP